MPSYEVHARMSNILRTIFALLRGKKSMRHWSLPVTLRIPSLEEHDETSDPRRDYGRSKNLRDQCRVFASEVTNDAA
jgi:hypothetical protein